MKEASRRYWFGEAPSNEELEERLRHIAGTTLQVLGGEKVTPEGIEDMVWLVAEYGHRELGIPARLDVAHHLLQAARTDVPLHLLRRYYREHFFHALDVCLFGHILLESRWSDGRFLWKKVGGRLRPRADKERVLRLWYITALFHDIGYGIELVKGVRQLLRFFENAEPLKALAEDLKGSLESLSKQLASEGFQKLRADEEGGEDHGVIGARHLEGLLKRIAKDDKTLDVDAYLPAVRAIARHNLRRKEKVSFLEDPLGFLLILCDTVQEWDRPHLTYETAPHHMLSLMRGGGGGWDEMSGPLSALRLSIELGRIRGKLKLWLKRKAPLHITLEFDEGINRNDTLLYTWLDATCNLQRLDMTGLDGDIKIEYVSPAWELSTTQERQQQFYRLLDAKRDTRMNFLEGWFPDRPNADGPGITNGAVSYWVERQGKIEREHLALHLRELSAREPITGNMDEFEEHLVRWEHYSENREFPSGYGLPKCPS